MQIKQSPGIFSEQSSWRTQPGAMPVSGSMPWDATLGLLEISFFLNEDSKEVNLNSFKLAKADIFDGIIGEAIFRK